MRFSGCGRAPAPSVASVWALALAALAAAAPAPAACKLLKLAELPVTMRGVPQVPVVIDGHPANMIVDTGSWKSTIWRPAAASLGLKIVASGLTAYGAGGSDQAGMVSVHDFTLAGFTVHHLDMLAVGRGNSSEFAGVLGEDLLSRMDIEFDLRAGAIRLFEARGCAGDQVVYWASSYFLVPLRRPPPDTNFLEAEVSVNGHDALAMFDSGAARSTITTTAIKRPGMSPEATPADVEAMRGISGRPITTDLGIFATLTIGQESIRNAPLRIADLFGADRTAQTGSLIAHSAFANADPLQREPDLVLGADFFLAHRMYIARNQNKLYFTYAGGPVFQASAPRHEPPAGEADGETPKP
jgi:predicted aspartyl protease